MTAPARWRIIREDDHLPSWRCDDPVDDCHAPATWVAEREIEYLGGLVPRIISQRCPDHLPMRVGHSTLPAPSVEAVTAATSPAVLDSGTIETPIAAAGPKDAETEPVLADTQPARNFQSPPPAPTDSDSAPPVAVDLDEHEEDEGGKT